MPNTVLLVHAEVEEAQLVKDSLLDPHNGNFIVDWVMSRADAMRRLRKSRIKPVAAILVSLNLPDSNGIETFYALYKAYPNIPILILSSAAREDLAKLAVQRGAQDYILAHDLNSYSLLKAVRNMIDRALNAEALFSANERAEVTLKSIGDAVVSTDIGGNVTFLNPIAESLTGWSAAEAIGRPIEEVLRIVDKIHAHEVVNPMTTAIRSNRAAKLETGYKLIRRDLVEFAIEDSAAPIHDRTGRVVGAVMVFHDVTQVQAISQRMSHLAKHDYLTNLPNRLLLSDRLSEAITTAQRQQQKLAVLFIDVDRFKHVNDSLGHSAGDELLLSVAARLLACVRSSDTVSRQGGDEFVILLSSVARPEDAALTGQKLIAAMAFPHSIEKHSLTITLSVGISIYPDDGADAATLIRNADVAMLDAKDNGRNNFQFFRPGMNRHALERQSLESDLRHALERNEFALHYQAKVDLDKETLTGAEALIRWRLPRRDLVPPKEFIPIAEQCGLIVPIGRWVLHQACVQSRLWTDAKLMPIPLAVNISAVELRSKDFVDHVRAILQETGANPAALEFELTETALMQDPQATIAVLKELKDMGILLTLDDFGTGYSSLSYLRRFPIDALKIDQSFVQGVCTNSDDAKIVSAVISLGRSFHLQVIAEGIETRAQFLALQGQDCGEGQGHYFRPPIAASEFTKLLGRDLSATVLA